MWDEATEAFKRRLRTGTHRGAPGMTRGGERERERERCLERMGRERWRRSWIRHVSSRFVTPRRRRRRDGERSDVAHSCAPGAARSYYTTPLCSRTAPTPPHPSLHFSLPELSLEPVEGKGLIREGLRGGFIHPLREVVQTVEARQGAAQEHRRLVHPHDASGHLVQRGLGVRVAAVPVKLGLLGELRGEEGGREEVRARPEGGRRDQSRNAAGRTGCVSSGWVFRGWCGRGDRGFSGGF